MEYFAGIDVLLEQSSVCVVDAVKELTFGQGIFSFSIWEWQNWKLAGPQTPCPNRSRISCGYPLHQAHQTGRSRKYILQYAL